MRGHIRRHRERWQAIHDLGPDPETGKRRQRSRTFGALDEAEDWLAEQLHNTRNLGIRTDPRRATVGEWLDRWLMTLEADGAIRGSTRAFYAGRVHKHIKPALGSVRLRDLTVEHVRSFYATLPAGVREKVHATLRPALADAVEDGKLASNPAVQASRRRRGKASGAQKRRVWRSWSEAELNAFLASVTDDRLGAMWRLYAMTGARRGELLGLRWSDVVDDKIRIERAFVLAGSAIVLEGTKTGRERTVDLDEGTAAALEAWRKAQIAERLAAGPAWLGDEWVFTTLRGEPLKPDWASRRFRELADLLNVARIRLHDLRHTHASIGLKAGVPAHVMSERLGHSSVTTTLAVYAHVIGNQQRDAADLVAEALRGAEASRSGG